MNKAKWERIREHIAVCILSPRGDDEESCGICLRYLSQDGLKVKMKYLRSKKEKADGE